MKKLLASYFPLGFFYVLITNIYSRMAQIDEINNLAVRIRDAASRVLLFSTKRWLLGALWLL